MLALSNVDEGVACLLLCELNFTKIYKRNVLNMHFSNFVVFVSSINE